jgi:uncharacterized protein YidB (DUF937 family)
MSEFLGQMLGALGPAVQALPGLLTQLVGSAQGAAGGGLPALLQQLENAGLAKQVRSWIGPDENLPVSAEQLAQAFPREQVEVWARQAGTTPEALLKVLAQALPHAVDHATPQGELPPAGTPPPDFAHVINRLFGR